MPDRAYWNAPEDEQIEWANKLPLDTTIELKIEDMYAVGQPLQFLIKRSDLTLNPEFSIQLTSVNSGKSIHKKVNLLDNSWHDIRFEAVEAGTYRCSVSGTSPAFGGIREKFGQVTDVFLVG